MRLAVLLLFCLLSLSALADGRMCISRDILLFANQATGTSTTQTSNVSNCGDAPFSFTDVSVHSATDAAYHVTSTCATGQALAAGASCRIDVTFAPTIPGQVSGGLWLRSTTDTPDQLVTFYGRGVDAQAGTTTLQFVPSAIDFAPQVLNTTSQPQTVTLRNAGPSTLTLRAVVMNGPAAYDFRVPTDCELGVSIPPGASCDLYFYFTPTKLGMRAAQLNIDAPELATLAIMSIRGLGVETLTPTVDVVEFYNAPLNHYFLTAVAEEAAMLDRGTLGSDWQRTGLSFAAYAADASAGLPVCRFFGTAIGPSAHFYTADATECALVKTNPHWLYEGVAFRALLPGLGGCATGSQPVVRFFRPGADVSQSRHRYVRDAPTLATMRASQGWIEEGPVFCSPQ